MVPAGRSKRAPAARSRAAAVDDPVLPLPPGSPSRPVLTKLAVAPAANAGSATRAAPSVAAEGGDQGQDKDLAGFMPTLHAREQASMTSTSWLIIKTVNCFCPEVARMSGLPSRGGATGGRRASASAAEGEPVDVDEVGGLAAGEGQVDGVRAGHRRRCCRDRPPALPAAGVAEREVADRRAVGLSSRTSTSPLTPPPAPDATRA